MILVMCKLHSKEIEMRLTLFNSTGISEEGKGLFQTTMVHGKCSTYLLRFGHCPWGIFILIHYFSTKRRRQVINNMMNKQEAHIDLTALLSCCKFCIYTHPVNLKFTTWHSCEIFSSKKKIEQSYDKSNTLFRIRMLLHLWKKWRFHSRYLIKLFWSTCIFCLFCF